MTDPNCPSCRMYDNGECIVIQEGVSSICPCKECIIKIMCEEPCKEFDNMAQIIYDKRKTAKKKGSRT